MRRFAYFVSAFLLIVLAPLEWAPNALAQHNLERAQKEWPDLKLLAPKQVKSLNETLRADLQKRGCRIPMFTKWDGRHNVSRCDDAGYWSYQTCRDRPDCYW